MKTIGILVAMPKELTPFIEKTGEKFACQNSKKKLFKTYINADYLCVGTNSDVRAVNSYT